jgi:luciferase family oxidoreductase group 1
VWILGSSGASARLAALRGMGYSFAAHFSATPAAPAVRAYREAFVPSDEFPEPHVILGTSVVCAPTDEEADRLAGPMDLSWLRFHRGDIRPLPSLAEAEAYAYTPQERAFVEGNRARHIVGSPETVRARLTALAAEAGADEVIVTTQVHDPADRLRSYELLAEAMGLG